MSRRNSDVNNYSLADLPSLFEDPLSGISAVSLRPNFDAAGELETLKTKLQQKSDWNLKCEAVLRIMGLIKGGIFSFSSFDLSEIAQDLAACVTDLRSTLVRWGSMCLSAAAQALGAQFSAYVEVFVPALFKQTNNGTAIISQSCRLALLQIAASVPHRRTVRVILSEATSKSTIHRKIVAECIQKMQQLWPSGTYNGSASTIKSVITELKSDKAPEVRQIAREIDAFQPEKRTPSPKKQKQQLFNSYSKDGSPGIKSPLVFASANNSLKVTGRKQLFNSLNSFSPTGRKSNPFSASNSSFALQMPENEKEASSFAQQLFENLSIISKEQNGDDINNLLSYTTKAIELDPDNNNWTMVIPKFLTEVPSNTKNYIADILKFSKFDDSILHKALTVFGFENLISLYDQNSDKLQFAAAVMSKCPEYELSEEAIHKLNQISKKKSKTQDSKIVHDFIANKKKKSPKSNNSVNESNSNNSSSPMSPSMAMKKIANCIVSGESYTDLIRNLSESDDESAHEIEKSFSHIADLISKNKNHKIIERAIHFIEYLSTIPIDLTFNIFVSPIINLLKDEQSLLPPIAEKCLLQILKNCNIKSSLIPLVNSSSNEVGLILEKYLSSLSKKELTKYIEYIPDAILPLFESSSLTARRTSVKIYAQFYAEFGDSFSDQISKTSEINQELIKRYSHQYSPT